MATIIQPTQFSKAPWEQLDYTADYTKELQAINDTIASSFWTIPSKTVDDPANIAIILADGVTCVYDGTQSPTYNLGGIYKTPFIAVAVLAGGTLGQQYRIQNNMVTNGGRHYARQMLLTIKYR